MWTGARACSRTRVSVLMLPHPRGLRATSSALFRSFFFMCQPVCKCKKRFDIAVNIQTVFTFPTRVVWMFNHVSCKTADANSTCASCNHTAAVLVTHRKVLTFASDRVSRMLANWGLGAAAPPWSACDSLMFRFFLVYHSFRKCSKWYDIPFNTQNVFEFPASVFLELGARMISCVLQRCTTL